MRRTSCPRRAVLLLVAWMAAPGGCADVAALTGPAAPEEVASSLVQPVTRDDRVEALLLLSDGSLACNQLVEIVDEGDGADAYDELATGRHLLVTLVREPSLAWPGLYPGETAETLALADLAASRMSSGLVFLDGDVLLSETGGFVDVASYVEDGEASGTLDLGVVEGSWSAVVCGPLDRSGS